MRVERVRSYETKANFSSCQETFPERLISSFGKKFLIFHLLEYLQNSETYQEESGGKNYTEIF